MIHLRINDKEKFEVILRIGVCCLCGFSLSVASLPMIVPPAFRIMPGLISSIFAVLIPTLMFSLVAAIPSIVVMFLAPMAGSTLLLIASVVSDGLFVATFALYALLVTSLYFGKLYAQTSGVPSFYIVLTAMNGLTFRPFVQKGGKELVKLMWTEQGLENPLAVWRNYLIAICWGLAALALCIALPPFRTSRRHLSQSSLPNVLGQIRAVLLGENDDLYPLVHSWNALGDNGGVAMTTVFEPRICTSPSEDLVTPLKNVVIATDHLVLRSLLVFDWEHENAGRKQYNDSDTVVLQDASSILKACDDALSSNNEEDIERLQGLSSESLHEQARQSPDTSDAYFIYQGTKRLQAAVLAYLDAFNHPHEVQRSTSMQQRTKHMYQSAVAYVTKLLLPSIRMVQAIGLVFQPKRWSIRPIMWSLELVGGSVALVCMSIYWGQYSQFWVPVNNNYVGAVYDGWNLLAYHFTWLPTLEGTIKKGLQRVIGTCIGGFSAWLGIIICSGSYNDHTEINPYGLVAWLTITTMLHGYFFGLEPGFAARMGASKDHGYVGFYCTVTQDVIAFEAYLGAGDTHGLVVNRIVATLSGVFLAMIVMSLPPHVKGGDPKHWHDYLEEVQSAFSMLLHDFCNEKECSKIAHEGYTEALLSAARKKRQFASFVWNDANRMRWLPFLNVDLKLTPVFEQIIVTEAMVCHLSDDSGGMISAQKDLDDIRAEFKSLLEERKNYDETLVTENTGANNTGMDDVVFKVSGTIHKKLESLELSFEEFM